MAEQIVADAATATLDLTHTSFQLALRWKRFVASRRHREDIELDAIGSRFEKYLAATTRKLISTTQVARQMKSFEESKLVHEEWKGSLKTNDIFQLVARDIHTKQMNQKLKEIIEKLHFLPMQRLIKKPQKSRSYGRQSMPGRKVSRAQSPPAARRAVLVHAGATLKRDSFDFMSPNTVRLLHEDDSSLFQSVESNIIVESAMPHYDISKASFIPRLKILANRFGLEVPAQMRTAADELEFFTSVHAVFRTIITTQNGDMKYVTGATSKGRSILKRTDWPIPPGSICSSQIDAVRSFSLLKEKNCIDSILDSCSDFMAIESVQKITAWLQKQIEELSAVSKTVIAESERKNLSKRRKYDIIKGAWDRVYEEITKKEGTEKLDRGDHKRIVFIF